MKRLTRTLPLLLAAALQLLPLLRNIVTVPSAGSSMAIILRWGIGSAAALGAFDSISKASSPVIFTNPTNFVGTVGTFFTNNAAITNNGGDAGAYFVLNNATVGTGHLTGGLSTTSCMPNGLTFKAFDLNTGGSPQPVYGAISGIPTTPVTNMWVHIQAGYKSSTPAVVDLYITINPAVAAFPPTITNQPASQTNNVGNNATFSVTHGGTAPFKYQWYYNTNSPLLNQTNVSLTLTNLQLTNTGTYSVAITNAAGSTNSSFARLTVWQPPGITNQPVSVTNMAGGNATFTVGAGGVPSLAYQWSFNTNTALLNATNTSLTLTNVRAGQAGTYSVTITNAGGVTNSIFATLVVTNPPPPPLTAPVKSGGSFQFTFTPVIGLTNTVLTNSVLVGGAWNVFTNILPPATATPITIIDSPGIPSLYYKVLVVP
jgi:hypothetical protein